MPDQISIIAPDDWHVHLRDGEMLQQVVAHTARRFQRAIVMPNLRPPVTRWLLHGHTATVFRRRAPLIWSSRP